MTISIVFAPTPIQNDDAAKHAWPYNETAFYVQHLRPSFHFFSQEFGTRNKGNLHE